VRQHASADSVDLFEYLLRLGDDRLVLGHRLSEWCGHGPILEEDIALANIALDLIGQATLYLGLAAEAEGKGRNADALAYFREAVEFRNVQMVELPRGDFAFTIARQLLFDAYNYHLLEQLLESSDAGLAGIAAKGYKEARYHLRHSSEWIQRLGVGTEESHARTQRAVNDVWRFTGELFAMDELDQRMQTSGGADLAVVKSKWDEVVTDVLARATLSVPSETFMVSGGRKGRHTEYLGHMLSEMQIVARSHPGAEW
jgi:ring-1,2-phenylacetyl-CoA epoxidase subunit PaaC